jgi:hypothetical protein
MFIFVIFQAWSKENEIVKIRRTNFFSFLHIRVEFVILTVTLKLSVQSPPFDSVVRPVPRMVKLSKSRRSQQISDEKKMKEKVEQKKFSFC